MLIYLLKYWKNNMKKIVIAFTAILLHLITYNADAQLLSPYTAEEGLETAIDFTKSDLNFTTPVITAIATSNQEIDVSGITVNPGMNLTDGKSEAWVYVILDETTNETAVIGVVKIFIAFQALDLSNDGGFEIPEFVTEPITDDWIDTDDLVDDLASNQSFQNYIKTNPTAEPQTTALSVNTSNPLYMNNYPYWINTFGENENFICYTDALTGETDCLILSSVKPIEKVANTFSPNPATNSISLIYESNEILTSLKIYDIFGNIVYHSNEININSIDVSDLANGSYSVVYEFENHIQTEKLIIKK